MQRSSQSNGLVVAARVALLALAAAAVVAALLIGHRGDIRAPTSVQYVCPMHPKVVSSTQDDCPICRMKLEPARESFHHPPPSFTLPGGLALKSFDDTSRCKYFETTMEMRAPGWSEDGRTGVVLLHLDEIALLKPSETARFFPTTAAEGGARGVEVRLTDEPVVEWDRATSLVRFRVESNAGISKGSVGSVKFATRVRNGLVIRASSVLRSRDGPYVFVVSPDRRRVTKRAIEIGSVRYEYAAVVSGLRENEYVAAKHTFFLDAEHRLTGGAAL